MQRIHATEAASISELKKNPTKLISEAHGKPVAILNHNTATAYLVPAHTFEKILEQLDDQLLEKLVYQRLHDGKKAVKVNLNDL
ncbi:MAG TPA: type II toxin-antitoxin system Phd/YefM family antitoxin [Coxiellaceae bacterium]|nr:type II toxin-antitoxin system Phd/YefM family antitoxin [Coxiellaceae bacterium]